MRKIGNCPPDEHRVRRRGGHEHQDRQQREPRASAARDPASIANATPPRLARHATQSTAVGPSDQSSDADEQHAAERGAGEIGGVEPADPRGKAGQRQADRDAADDERHGNDGVGEGDRVDRDDRRSDAERDAQLRQEAQHDARSETATPTTRQAMAQALGREEPRREIDEQRADGHAEHRDRQRDERKVVQHRHAEDPRQQDFVHQRREGDEEDADVGCRRAAQGVGEGASGIKRVIIQCSRPR